MTPSSSPRRLANLLSTLQQEKYRLPFIIVFSAALAILMFGENIKAQWWVIDDHEIVYFLGSDHVLKAGEIFSTLIHETEVGKYLQFPRFRPVYYTIRLLECWLWGDNPALWYEFRIGILIFFITVFWYLASHKAGFFLSSLISLYILTFQFWQDIVARLGPSEIYGALGLPLFALGVHIIVRTNKITGWWLIFLGSIICTGSKENFLFLLLPLAYIVWDSLSKKRLDIARALLSFGAFTWMIWIAYVVVVTTRSLGGDIYDDSVKVTDKLHLMLDILKRFDVIALFLLCVPLFLSFLWFRQRNPFIAFRSKETGILVLILGATYLSQIFIYKGEWPSDARYDFPGLLVGPLLIVIFIYFFQNIVIPHENHGLQNGFYVVSALLVSILVFPQLNNIRGAQIRSHENVARTVTFSEKMNQLVQVSTQHPKYNLIIQADDPGWDYEPVFSYIRFLRFYGVKNTTAFLWAGPEPRKIGNKFDRTLANDLRDLSLYAKAPTKLPVTGHDYTPLPDVKDNPNTPCILIVISGKPGIDCPITITSNWH